MTDIAFITLEEALFLHKKVISRFGGSLYPIRDIGLLESALYQPQATAFNNYLHKNLYEMAAAYCFHIIKNHPFVDGNKRTGLLIALTFLESNGLTMKASSKKLYDFTLAIASSKISKNQASEFFKEHTIHHVSN